jgi:hypothetical protein
VKRADKQGLKNEEGGKAPLNSLTGVLQAEPPFAMYDFRPFGSRQATVCVAPGAGIQVVMEAWA